MKEEEEGGEGAVAVIVDRRLNPLRELQVILSDNTEAEEWSDLYV